MLVSEAELLVRFVDLLSLLPEERLEQLECLDYFERLELIVQSRLTAGAGY